MNFHKKGGKTTLKRHGTVHLSKAGRKGGNATKKVHGVEHYKKAGKLGALKRWGQKEKATA